MKHVNGGLVMKLNLLLLPIILSAILIGGFATYHFTDSRALEEETQIIEQQEVRYNMKTDTYERVEYTTPANVDILHIEGRIEAIDSLGDNTLKVMVTAGEETLTVTVNEDTYIGNYTKSPKKPMDYLEVGMDLGLSYYVRDNICIATSINVIE